jgi:hypothetical protein
MNPFEAGAESPMESALAVGSDESVVISRKAGMHLAYAELCRRHSTSTFRAIHCITRSREDAEAQVRAGQLGESFVIDLIGLSHPLNDGLF